MLRGETMHRSLAKHVSPACGVPEHRPGTVTSHGARSRFAHGREAAVLPEPHLGASLLAPPRRPRAPCGAPRGSRRLRGSARARGAVWVGRPRGNREAAPFVCSACHCFAANSPWSPVCRSALMHVHHCRSVCSPSVLAEPFSSIWL